MLLGDFMEYTALLAFLIAPVVQIVSIGTQLTEAFAGLERTREVLRERPEDLDPRRTVALGTVNGEVEFDHVGFSYDKDKQVLFDVSFRSEPGTVTALVGSSGSGKSTIISVWSRPFMFPNEGRVTVDGVDLSTVRLNTYRTQLGVVLQDTFLFDGTIEENIAFARPGATKEQILEACRIARVDEFAENFEKKYDTIVGERGVKLSGGQRQRVSIARAILADPRILILDEATSSLDSESEALIQEGLKYLMKGRTTFVIAHRLSTIRRADQILVVEAGKNRRARHARNAIRSARSLLGSVHPPARLGSEPVPRARRRRHSGRHRPREGSERSRTSRRDAHVALVPLQHRLQPGRSLDIRSFTAAARCQVGGSPRQASTEPRPSGRGNHNIVATAH